MLTAYDPALPTAHLAPQTAPEAPLATAHLSPPTHLHRGLPFGLHRQSAGPTRAQGAQPNPPNRPAPGSSGVLRRRSGPRRGPTTVHACAVTKTKASLAGSTQPAAQNLPVCARLPSPAPRQDALPTDQTAAPLVLSAPQSAAKPALNRASVALFAPCYWPPRATTAQPSRPAQPATPSAPALPFPQPPLALAHAGRRHNPAASYRFRARPPKSAVSQTPPPPAPQSPR